MGYYPDNALSSVEDVQKLKKQGLSMSVISERFKKKLIENPSISSQKLTEDDTEHGNVAMLSFPEATIPPFSPDIGKSGHLALELSIDDIPGPAYMVNNNFELVWWNEHANKSLLGMSEKLSGVIESRNLILLLMTSENVKQL